jgi:hypothetical protein
VSAAKYIECAETVFRAAPLIGQKEHWQQLLALVEEYLALADGAEVDEEQRMRIDALRAEIGLRSDQE